MRQLLKGFGAFVLIAGISAMGLAAPGDIQRVTGHRANLRAGPSEKTAVRTQLRQGDRLIELDREGNWLGVRSLGSDEEGWIHSSLVELVSPSRLERSKPTPSFRDLSEGFDSTLHGIDDRLQYCASKIKRVRKDCG